MACRRATTVVDTARRGVSRVSRGAGTLGAIARTVGAAPVEVVVRVPVSELLPGESPRSKGLDQDHVRMLASVEGPLPPISVHRETMRVIDGAHRVAAARLAGRTEVEAVFFHGGADEAFRLGVAANVTHGLPLSLSDRRAAALRILRSHPQLSDRAIARSAGLSHKTVAALRAAGQPEAEQPGGSRGLRIGVDGRVRPLDATEGRLAAGRIIAERPDATLREVASAAGISLGTAKDVRARMLAGDSPLPGGRAPAKPSASAQADLDDAMGFLRRDPALRYSDSGRTLLQWLAARTLTVDQWRENSGGIPPHLSAAIVSVARQCARTWTEIADELEGS